MGHSPSQDLASVILEGNAALPRVKVYSGEGEGNYLVACRHCKDYPCLNACIAGALEYDPEKGLLFDAEKCVGCWMCVMVCPYGAVRSDSRSAKSVRCDLCADINDPRCAKNCPTKAIVYVEEKK
ncbi:MAG TPA: 4Fe-4S ferredoxin [Candidatus Omnitrophica bacterium]|nr:4Fe-4S ferredoxin [Candidatus Omnitrophota bacterium]